MNVVIEQTIAPGIGIAPRRPGRSMKLVSCILRPDKLDNVTRALNTLNLVGGMTVIDVRGSGQEQSDVELYRGQAFRDSYVPRVKIELVVESSDVERVEELVKMIAQTGEVGDGRIFVFDVIDALRIRTGERGTSAL